MANIKGKAPKVALPSKKADFGEDLGEVDEEDIDDTAGAMLVPVVNHSAATVKFKIGTRVYLMRSGQVENLEAAYGAPRQVRAGGDALPSVVELETNRKVLPVADPRVQKDESGVPIAHLEYRAKQKAAEDAKRAAKNPPQNQPRA